MPPATSQEKAAALKQAKAEFLAVPHFVRRRCVRQRSRAGGGRHEQNVLAIQNLGAPAILSDMHVLPKQNAESKKGPVTHMIAQKDNEGRSFC